MATKKKAQTKRSSDIVVSALSLRQPYAEQVMSGEKKIEYRGIPTHKRERVHIYASLGRRPVEEWEACGLEPYSLPTGVLIGTIEIVDCKHNKRHDDYEWILAKPQRAKRLQKPKNQPQPVWFHPFG